MARREGHFVGFEMPAPGLIGETCLLELPVAAIGTAASNAQGPKRSAARGLQFLKSENVRHKLPPFFCDSPAIKSAGNSKRRAIAGHAKVDLRGRMRSGKRRRSVGIKDARRSVALLLHCDDRSLREVLGGTPGAIFQRSCVATPRRVSPSEEICKKGCGGSEWTRRDS